MPSQRIGWIAASAMPPRNDINFDRMAYFLPLLCKRRATMSISAISNSSSLFGAASNALNPAQVKATDKAFAALLGTSSDDSPQGILHEITKDGITGMMKWKVKKLEEQIAKKVMAAQNLTPEQIAAMPDAQRVSTENQIMKAVAQALKQAMKEQMDKQAKANGQLDATDPSSPIQSLDIMA
jgi:hypothetical protein